MGDNNVYESSCIAQITGETLRPGGFSLTKKAIDYCNIQTSGQVLDLGCGNGATVRYLHEEYDIRAVGVDASRKLLNEAKRAGEGVFVYGFGEMLPFEADKFDMVIAECTLSLMYDKQRVLSEVFRVLKPQGWFVITDVYAKNPEYIDGLKMFKVNTCLGGLHDLDKLRDDIIDRGFEVQVLEEHSHELKDLMVKIIFSYGSMKAFWDQTTDSSDAQLGQKFQQNLGLCKPGYFLMIGMKVKSYG